jgi:hypothetical protein
MEGKEGAKRKKKRFFLEKIFFFPYIITSGTNRKTLQGSCIKRPTTPPKGSKTPYGKGSLPGTAFCLRNGNSAECFP